MWCLVRGEQTKPINFNDLTIWEDWCDQVRGINDQTISNSLHIHIEVQDILIELWKTLASLFDKFDDDFT